MTTKQAIRKLLSNTDRFIIGDYNGQKWQCPDAYIAVKTDIYGQYKPKKSQDVNAFADASKQPKMDTIFNRSGEYAVAHVSNTDDTTVTLTAGDTNVLVNKQYYEFMQVLYPDTVLMVDTGFKYSPVRVIENNEPVALIMPLHG